jgi:hypothetical protein
VIAVRARELDGERDPGQWRTELVRDILQQAALDRQQRLDPAGHPVEGPGEGADLILARRIRPRRQIALTKPLDRAVKVFQRGGQV